jgi:RHS repeat-associated protein
VIAPQTYTWNGQPDRASIKTGTGTPVTVTFDAASRPVSDSAGNTYGSDKEGRITGIPGKTLVYDALGRLAQVKAAPSGTVLANYTYDPLDRLRTINVGSATNRFRYAGLTTAVAQIVDGSGTVLINHATDLNGIELYDFTPGGATQTYLGRNDHDDVTWTAGTTGAVTALADYDPYGNLASSSGTTPATRWQGSYYDSSSGLYYVNARWYSPMLGTFLSDDPLTGTTANPESRNAYAYGTGDAVDSTDPSGNCTVGTNNYWVLQSSGCTYSPSVVYTSPTRAPMPARPLQVHWYSQYKTAGFAWAGAWMGYTSTAKQGCTGMIGNKSKNYPRGVGCALTSAAMLIYSLHPEINPGTLNDWMSSNHHIHLAHGGTQCDIDWSALGPKYGVYFTLKSNFTPEKSWQNGTLQRTWLPWIKQQLSLGNPVVAHITAPIAPSHFVVITGIYGPGSGTDFVIADPAQSVPPSRNGIPFFKSGYALSGLRSVAGWKGGR